jgi:hypothetical protein
MSGSIGYLTPLLAAAVWAGLPHIPANAAPASSASHPATAVAYPVPPLQIYVFAIETSAPGPDPRCPLFYGYVLEANGGIFRYDDSCEYGSTPVGAPDGLQNQRDLDDRYAFRRTLVGRIDPREVRRRAAVILPASWSTLRPDTLDWTSRATQASIGPLYYAYTTRTYIAYSYNSTTGLFQRVPLRVMGAHNASSNAQAAAELVDWLDRVIDPGARDAAIARDLTALPVESLEAGCSGGIAGASSRVTLDRSGLLTVRDTWRTKTQLDRVWNVPRNAAAELLDEATRDRIMQRNLHGGTPDYGCWLTATIGAVRHQLSWSPGEPKLPGNVRHLFNRMKAVGRVPAASRTGGDTGIGPHARGLSG